MNEISNQSPNIIISSSKERIFSVASELFSEFGFLGVSMADIAKKLNITKPALYYHFKSKKELYLKTLERSSYNLVRTIKRGVAKAKSSDQKLSQLIYGYLYFGLKEENIIKSSFLKTPELDPEITNYIAKLRKKINTQFQTFLKEIFQEKRKKENIDLKFATLFLLGTMDRLILETNLFNKNKKLNIKKKTSQILKIVNSILKGRE